jgi:hypothetical protein
MIRQLRGLRLWRARTQFTAVAYFALALVSAPSLAADAPAPLVTQNTGVGWWFTFKFNTQTFPNCSAAPSEERVCLFGGDVQSYRQGYSQQFVFASDAKPTLTKGGGCLGDTVTDPVGATFDEIYNGDFYYVVWNDQFYDDPPIKGCTASCSSPWGHSKGILAWNDAGEGIVMQVSTPSWPASGSHQFPRKSDGNTLGCLKDDDILVSQQFFALKLSKDDVVQVLRALQTASVVTDPSNPQVAKNGGPPDIQALAKVLGQKSLSSAVLRVQLSSGVGLLAKPSKLAVPPWQLVSAELGGVDLRVASWWEAPEIPSTDATTTIDCWDPSLPPPGSVQIATSGHWETNLFGLTGGSGPNFNHAKIGISTSGTNHFVIFGDMNQQGALTGKCSSAQNGRGGLFYILDNQALADSVASLIGGDSAPTR